LKELQPQGVKDIFNITVKDDSGGRRNTNTFIVTFKTPVVPKYIIVGYIRVPVAVYIPNPLRCFKCQKFGHGKNACRERETCATCGQIGHTSNDCTSELKCPNCSGDHSAFSKNCPKWLFEKRVQQLKAEKNISFIEARGLSMQRVRAGPLREAEPLLRWWPPGVSPHSQPLVWFIHKLISRGLRDRKNPLSSLPLQADQVKKQPRLPQINFLPEGITLMVQNLLENSNPLKVLLPMLKPATKTVSANHMANPLIRRRRSLDFIGLPSLILRS